MKTATKVLTEEAAAVILDKLSYDIVSISWLEETRARKSPRDILNHYKILVMLKGQASVHIGRNVYYTKSGDCILFAPGSLYHAQLAENSDCQFAAINFNMATPMEDKNFRQMTGIKDIAIYPQLVSENIKTSIVNIFENCFEEREGYFYQVTLLLKRLVGTIFYLGHPVATETASEKSRRGEEATVLMCHRYLINNPSLAVTVEDLCKLCNVSQSYLYKCFSNVLGMSTKQFITDTKLDMTAKELLQTNKSVAQIAADNGYSNGYQFSNVFKKKYKISPTAYRKNNR